MNMRTQTRIFLISLFSLVVAACSLRADALPAVVTATSAPTTSGPAAATDALPAATSALAPTAPVKTVTPTSPPVGTETSPNATLSPSPTLAPIVFSGKGAQAAGVFALDGLALFKFEHDSAGIYSVQLLDERGKLVAVLFSGVGKATVSAAQGAEAGLYVANVNAEGKWSLSVERLRLELVEGLSP